jgi:hypothetical protein
MDSRRLIPVGVAVTALLVLAGAASHGRPLRPGAGTGPSAAFFDYVATTLLLFAVALAVVVLIALRADKTGGGPPRRGRWNVVSSLLMFAGAALVAYLISTSKFEQRLREAEQRHTPKPTTLPTTRQTPPAPKHLRNARVRWDEVIVVALLVGGVCVYLFLTRSRGTPLRPLTRQRRAMARALDDSIDDLRRDPDPRRAIIAAYARMERALAHAGVPRAPAEAPYEYLERSLVELETSADAARRLTALFERAKFSQHEPAESMRHDAIDALVAVRDELRRPAAAPVAA